jgi:uncharacterized protein DUF6335
MSKRKTRRKARTGRGASTKTAKRSPAKRRARGRRPKTARSSRATGSRRIRTAATRRSRPAPRRRGAEEDRGETGALVRELNEYTATGPAVSAGDIDADWQRAESSGEETTGGSVATPDQDVVDEIGHALGVEQASQAPVRSSEEILEDRDRRYWELERRANRKADRRREP